MAAQKPVGAGGVARDVVSRMQRAWGESPFFQAQLKGPAPNRLLFHPVEPGSPDAALGRAVLAGRVTIGADSIDCEGEFERLWDLAAPGGQAYFYLHEFSWLHHAEAVGEAAEGPVRALMRGWLDRFDKWSPEAWEPYLTGERLTRLCCHSGLLLKGADALWRSRVLTSMARQTRHLARAGHRADTGYERLMTALSLTLVGLCLPGCDEQAERGLELLRRELRLQIRPDGGHVSRNPSKQLRIVLRLRMVLKALEARRREAPGFLRHILGRAAANVQFFRLGDGQLAVFNGGYEDDGGAVLAAVQLLDPDAAPVGFARHTGFQRLSAARSVILADVSTRAPAGGFESAGSFHFSSGRNRIVVNCGNGDHLPGDWGRLLRQAAAHSTLSSETAAGAAALAQGGAVVHRRAEDMRGQLLAIDRAFGGAERQGPRFVRRFYLSAAGDNLRGEDRLIDAPPALRASWRVRFHLHPAVKASLARDRKSVILALPHREGWRFRTNVDGLSLEKSIYCGAGGLPLATQQIVLASSDLEPVESGDMVARWAFQRLGGGVAGDGKSGVSR